MNKLFKNLSAIFLFLLIIIPVVYALLKKAAR